MEKYHKQEVSPVEEENERDETFETDNPQIDSERTKNNYHMNSNAFGWWVFCCGGKLGKMFEFYIKRMARNFAY